MRLEKIISPNSEIERIKTDLLRRLQEIIPKSEIEFIGGMAVPMRGRPEIDVMVISEEVDKDKKILIENGYKDGPTVNDVSYLKKYDGDIEIAIQIIPPDNKMIDIHRAVVEMLRQDESLRKQYEDFKQTLNGLTREEYKFRKNEWVKKNLLESDK